MNDASRPAAPDNAFLDGVARAALGIAGASLVGMVVVQAWQVFARYVLNDSPGWTEPVAVLLMNAAMMFGAATGVRGNSHFGFFVGVMATPPAVRRVLLAFASLVALSVGAVLAFWGGQLALDGWDVVMAGAGLPQGVAYLPVCIGGALIALFAAERLLFTLRQPAAMD